MQSCPIGTPRMRGDLARHLGGGQHAAVARLRALAQLELDHLHLRIGGGFGELSARIVPSRVAAAEIARADLPDDIAAALAVIRAERRLRRCRAQSRRASRPC